MLTLFFQLLIAHFVCDYPLQGDFLSKAKNHVLPIPGVPFYQALSAHAGIQAGGVWLVTGRAGCAALEFILHFAIDFLKCEGLLNFNQDQAAHVFCKALYVLLLWGVIF